MKSIVAISLGLFFGANVQESILPNLFINTDSSKISSSFAETTDAVQKDICTLTISGYGNYDELGRIQVTITSEGSTCEEAADELRAEIIKREIRIDK